MIITDKNAIKALKALDTVAKEYAQEGREYLRNIRWIPGRKSLIATDGRRLLEYSVTQEMAEALVADFGAANEVSLNFTKNELTISKDQRYFTESWRVIPTESRLSTFQHIAPNRDNNIKRCLDSTRTGKRYINNLCAYLISYTGIYFDINLAYGMAPYKVEDVWLNPDNLNAPLVMKTSNIQFILMPKYKNW